MISKKTISQIYDSAIIEDVISDFLNLKKSGSNYKCLSPFVDEKTPSFVVSPSKQIFKCFSSGKAGNVVTFLMEQEKMSYQEALKYLANKYNIVIEYDSNYQSNKQVDNNIESFLIINKFAKDYYHNNLVKKDEGIKIGLPYMKQRGFGQDIIDEFELGYSLNCKDCFFKEANKKGFKMKYLESLGIIKGKEGSYWDYFRDRIMFPIHNISGSIVGFGARALSRNNKVKYLNSSESDVYNKSELLYGIYQAKDSIRKNDMCFLVEGYTDLLRLHQLGIKNSVSTSGTAITPSQIRFIKQRFTDNISIIYDGDEAGIKASFRAIELIMEEELNVNIINIPFGEDPDSLFSSFTKEDITDYIKKNTYNFIDFKILQDGKSTNVVDEEKTITYLSHLANISGPIKKELYFSEISDKFKVTKDSLQDRVNKKKYRRFNNEPKKDNNYNNYDYPPWEKDLIKLLIVNANDLIAIDPKDENYVEIKVSDIVVNELERDSILFTDEFLNNIYKEVCSFVKAGNEYNQDNFIKNSNHDIAKFASYLVAEYLKDPRHNVSKRFQRDPQPPIERELKDYLRKLKSNFLEKKIKDKNKELYIKENTTNHRHKIIEEIIDLKAIKSEIDKNLGGTLNL